MLVILVGGNYKVATEVDSGGMIHIQSFMRSVGLFK
jgi:hypothetical protein